MKRARKFVMQKLAGKGKDISDLSIAQKEKLEKKLWNRFEEIHEAWR